MDDAGRKKQAAEVNRAELVRGLGAGSGAGRPGGLMRIWLLWERLASWIWRADPLPGSPRGGLRVRLKRYRGKPVELPDAVIVRRGDLIAEVHFNNRVMAQVAAGDKWRVMSAVKDELAVIAAWARDGNGRDVKAVYGETIIARTAAWLGFTRRTKGPTVMGRLRRMYLSGLLQTYSQLGTKRLERGSRGVAIPEDVWISREELLRRYG